MRSVFVAGLAAFAGLSLNGARESTPVAFAVDHGVEVTSAADTGTAGGAVCPHDTACTLRAAIEAANADLEPDRFIVTFSADVFPQDEPVAIPVAFALPTVTRDGVSIDGSAAGVELFGASPSLTSTFNGLTVSGANFQLRGLRIHGFNGSCLAVSGPGARIGSAAAGSGNLFGGCNTGVAASGAEALIQGNLIGFTREGDAEPVETGIVVSAQGATIGGTAAFPDSPNRIGFARIGILVGSGPSAFGATHVERNILGSRPTGEPAPIGTGIALAQPSNGSTVTANIIENASVGVAVRPDAASVSTTGNRITANTFDSIATLAIDLGEDGIRNLNDTGDADTGPNTLLNHPVISRVTQTRLTGAACAGCQVQVYLAAHKPGGTEDYGRHPLSGANVQADAGGQFSIDNPAAAPGDWLVAIATDTDGNTSEFGPPARVGAGAVLCGNVQLRAGWNHVGYFGSETVALLSTFPVAPTGAVTAIYRAVDGTTEWERWFSTTPIGRTLHSVQPGEAYWFFASAPVTLPGGFSISFPVPVQLKAGPNDLVYLGASANVLDALGSLSGAFHDLYHYDSFAETWRRYGDPGVPSWAQSFTSLEACATYQVILDSPATLIPLQP